MNLLKITIISASILSFNSAQAIVDLHSYDLNQDGTKDRFEYSVNEKIIRVEEDRDGDTKIDFKTFLDDKTYSKIEWQYSGETGKIIRKTSHLIIPENKTRILTEVDKDGDGNFEVQYNQVISNVQDQDHCGEVDAKIRDLSKTVLKVVAKNQKGLLPTGLGYKVDVECYNKWGDDFNKIVKEVAVGGLQCLMNLNKTGKMGTAVTGAARNAFDITKLYKNDGISLVCSEESYTDWADALAHASINSSEIMMPQNIKHPFISLNPSKPYEPEGQRTDEIAELKGTIFHETLHNLGYAHNEDIEFSYTCGKCCFDKETGDKKDLACKICTGNYKNVTDINYVRDIMGYSKLVADPQRGVAAVTKYLKENPTSTEGLVLLAASTSNGVNPIGSELSKIITAKHGSSLSVNDSISLAITDEDAKYPEFKAVAASSKAISSSLYELYHNKSGANAVAILEKNKAIIKQELLKIKTAPGSRKNPYIYSTMKKVLDGAIYDMWVNSYPGDNAPGKDTSVQAFALSEYFK